MASSGLSIGDKVFAKLRGYPYWPAIIENIMENGYTNKYNSYQVRFYGGCDTATIKGNDICLYEENKQKYGQLKMDNHRNKRFNKALEEAELDKCPTNPVIADIGVKIDNCGEIDDLDLETSLTLAAEAGNALLLENSQLKQQVHDLKLKICTLMKELDM